ncbi:DinB family protein [Kribbella deserti]|uniref:DinB family protein n=1 Tax=Kribbella deserti TaxID=1926257 RepID=A0ABV6QVA1_9ACTN
MSEKQALQTYLQRAREALIWKLDGLSEYDVRRPLTPTGTNLLGLVKHAIGVEIGYFAFTFDRPFPEHVQWATDEAEDNADMWATADESREFIVGLYQRVCAHADTTIAELPLDAPGFVPWWGPERGQVVLHQIIVHTTADLQRHAGQADILRELIDGTVGMRADAPNMPTDEPSYWESYRAELQAVADTFK